MASSLLDGFKVDEDSETATRLGSVESGTTTSGQLRSIAISPGGNPKIPANRDSGGQVSWQGSCKPLK